MNTDALFSDPPNTTPERIATLDRLGGPFDPTPCSTCGLLIRLGGTTVGEQRFCSPCWAERHELALAVIAFQ